MSNKRNSSRSEFFFVFPWWFNLVLAAVAYVVLKWLLPDILLSHALPDLANASQHLAGLAVGTFVFLAGFIFMKQRDARIGPSSDAEAESRRRMLRTKVGAESAVSTEGKSVDARQVDVRPDAMLGGKTPEWSLELLRSLEWKRLEDLACGFYTQLGFRTRTLRHGADAYPIIELYWGEATQAIALIHCEKNGVACVEADAVRELHTAMLDRGIGKGVLLTSLDLSNEAYALAAESNIELINGRALLDKIRRLLPTLQREMLLAALEGDYLTPSCNFCGVKMTRRSTVHGDSWSCPNPRCGEALVWPSQMVA